MSRLIRATPATSPAPQGRRAAPDSGPPGHIGAASGNGDEALQAAAVHGLQDGQNLRQLAGLIAASSPASPSIEHAAQTRMAQLLDAGAVDFAGLCAGAGNGAALLAVAALSGNPEHIPQALALIDDPRRIAKLVVDGPSSRLRQLAAQAIEDPAELRQLLKQLRGKDKSVYKIIKQKCDALLAEDRRTAQIESDIHALCASLERHSHRIYDVLYPASLRQFDAQWQSLEAQAQPEARDRVHQAFDACREVIARHERQLAEQAAEVSQQAALRAAREEAAAHAAAEAQLRDEALALAAAEAAKARAAEERIHAEKMAAEALALRQIGALLGRANGALRGGNTSQAAGLRRAIEQKLSAAPGAPPYLTNQVQQLDIKLNELKEWKEHAVAPKRSELIEEMQGLIGSSEEPKALADRIRQLQEEWKTISKGIVSESEEDWQRFHRASEAAYQPCREHFEAQARLRQANLEKRESVLERLHAFETAQSGESPDWPAVAAVLREARQEWRRHFPVDRAAGLAVQEKFDAALGRLHARLDAWHAQNAAEKKSLILRAQHLLGKDDSRETVDAVKRLQLLWKNVGAVPRDQDQALWNEFREHCDAVYQKRQQAHAEYAAGLEANKARAVALCEEAETAAALTGPALSEAAGKVPEWRAAFEALGEMPRAEQRALHDRFERALTLCQTRFSQQRAQDQERSFADLFEAARRIQVYGWAVVQDAETSERDSLKQAAETFIAGVSRWPKGGAQALKDAWAKAADAHRDAAAGSDAAAGRDASVSQDPAAGQGAAAHESALRMLCIRCEILTDLTTPPEDQALRREYQVQRLVRHMGQRGDASPDELDALAMDWVRVGPVSTGTYEFLLARFVRCRGKT